MNICYSICVIYCVVGYVTGETTCQIGSFTWTHKSDVVAKNISYVGDTVVLQCQASTENCVATLTITGPDIKASSTLYGYSIERVVKLATEGKQTYMCQFYNSEQRYLESLSFQVVRRADFISRLIRGATSPECIGLWRTWVNMKTDTVFPIQQGTVVTVSCNEGYTLQGSSEVTCDKDTQYIFSDEPDCSWIKVTKNEYIDLDRRRLDWMDTSVPETVIGIKTSSALAGIVRFDRYSNLDYLTGSITINLSSPPTYTLHNCMTTETQFPAELPVEQEKTWTITFEPDDVLDTETEDRVMIECNGVEVLNTAASCKIDYGNKMKFSLDDTASNFYRILPGWRRVRNHDAIYVNMDLQKNQLQIKTKNPAGSYRNLVVPFQSVGGISIYFEGSSAMKYMIDDCSTDWTPFPVTLPTEEDKVWTITRTSGGFNIDCNGIKALDIVFSDSTCTDKTLLRRWNSDIKKILFPYTDEASTFYRGIPIRDKPCTITDLSYAKLDSTNYEISCKSSCSSEMEITLDGTSIKKMSSVESLVTPITLSETKQYTVVCVMEPENRSPIHSKELVITHKRECKIGEFTNEKLTLYCDVMCEGMMSILDPSGQKIDSKTITSITGGYMKITLSPTSEAGYYTCDYVSGERDKSTLRVHVDFSCSTPPSLTSTFSNVFVGQRFTLVCTSECEYGLVLSVTRGTVTTRLGSNFYFVTSEGYNSDQPGDLTFSCVIPDTIGTTHIPLQSELVVKVNSCKQGEKYTTCGTSCGIVYCSSDSNARENCLSEYVCNRGQCRCPDHRPYWKFGDSNSKSSCVNTCADSFNSTESADSTRTGPIIGGIAAGVVVVLVACVCAIKKCNTPKPTTEQMDMQPAEQPHTGHVAQPHSGYVAQPHSGYAAQPYSGYMTQPGGSPVVQPGFGYMAQPGGRYMAQPGGGYMAQPGGGYMAQPGGGYMAQPGGGPAAQPGFGPVAQPGGGPVAQPSGGPVVENKADKDPDPIYQADIAPPRYEDCYMEDDVAHVRFTGGPNANIAYENKQ